MLSKIKWWATFCQSPTSGLPAVSELASTLLLSDDDDSLLARTTTADVTASNSAMSINFMLSCRRVVGVARINQQTVVNEWVSSSRSDWNNCCDVAARLVIIYRSRFSHLVRGKLSNEYWAWTQSYLQIRTGMHAVLKKNSRTWPCNECGTCHHPHVPPKQFSCFMTRI